MKSWTDIRGSLADYVDANWLRESALKRRLRAETGKMPAANMQISAHQGQQLALLARTVNARIAVEVGTFTGYSALCVAEVLPKGGKFYCCDVSWRSRRNLPRNSACCSSGPRPPACSEAAQALPKIACFTLSPGLMPSRRALPPLISSAPRTGCSLGIVSVDFGTALE